MDTNRSVRRMALAAAIAVALSAPARAATFTVGTDADNGAGSLRAALDAANAAPGPDTVLFDSTFFAAATPRTIVLASTLQITDSVTVTGPGAAIAALDGNEAVRVLQIQPAAPGIAVEITGLTLQRGFAIADGGCLLANDTHLVLEDSVLTGCQAGPASGGALAIFDGGQQPPLAAKGTVTPASLVVRDTLFSSNRARGAGALTALFDLGGDITLEGITVENNEAEDFAGGLELVSQTGDIVLRDSVITGNTVADGGPGGGAIAYGAGDIRIENTQFTGNVIRTDAGYSYGTYAYGGGAMVLGQGDVVIVGSRFENNAILGENQNTKGGPPEALGGLGGGLFASPVPEGRSFSIDATHFVGNAAGLGGGALVGFPFSGPGPERKSKAVRRYLDASKRGDKVFQGTHLVQESRFVDNRAAFGGPGIALLELGPPSKALSPGFTFDRVTLSGNELTGEEQGLVLPGAITILGSAWPVQLINSTVSGNEAGIITGFPSGAPPGEPSLILDHTTVAGNTVVGVGSLSGSPVRGPLARWFKQQKDYPLPEQNLSLRNSVIAGTTEGPDLAFGPENVEMLHSLVQTTEPADFTGFDDFGGNQLGVDPLLAPLALAGHSFLEVHVPQAGSPLIDAGDPDVAASDPPSIDQRDAPRITGTAIDIGSVEQVIEPGVVDFDPATLTVSETAGIATLTAVRSGGDDGAIGVAFATADGSAQAGQDYTTASGSLSWADGESGAKTFIVPLANDALVEADETFTATLTEPTGGATLGNNALATVTLTSDDLPPVGTLGFNPASASVNETAGTVTLTVSRSGGSAGEVSVGYTTANASATAGSDYTTSTGTLTWASGDTADKTVAVPILDDALVESDETFTMTLSEPSGGATIGAGTATVTVVSNDIAPAGTLALSGPITVNETGGNAMLTVSRTGGSNGEVGVGFTTTNGSAAAPADYTATSGTLTWASGDAAAKTILVPIVNDTEVEANEQFTVSIASPTGGATLGNSNSAVTIASDDVAATGMLEFQGAGNNGMVTLRFNENGAPVVAKAIVQIAVTRSGGSAGTASIDYATQDGSAVAPGDYTPAAGTLSWADGESGPRFISVNIVEDGLAEPDENFTIQLGNAQGAGLGANAQAQIVVVANGGAVSSGQLQTIPTGDARGWFAMLGAMLLAGWVALRRRV